MRSVILLIMIAIRLLMMRMRLSEERPIISMQTQMDSEILMLHPNFCVQPSDYVSDTSDCDDGDEMIL